MKDSVLLKTIACMVFAMAVQGALALGKKDSGNGASAHESAENIQGMELVVYAYDSFAGSWGPGPELVKRFEEASGCTVTLINCGSALQAFNRAALEKDNVQADVIIGIDSNLAAEAHESGILESYVPRNAESIVDASLVQELGGTWELTPYDYGYFALIYDSQSSVPAPTSLGDLTKDVYKKKFIIMDPRTSSPGLGFVAWTKAVFGDKTEQFWNDLKPSILTMTPGWSAGWGMFLNGEAPLVISYNTSPAYNVEYDQNDRFKTLLFAEGHVRQVEGAGVLKGAPHAKAAKAFIDFLVTKEAQELLPLTQWMYPVNKTVDLPQSYQTAAPLPEKTLTIDSGTVSQTVPVVMDILSR